MNYIKILFIVSMLMLQIGAEASSHREAPLIANDPLADNTDLYAFRSPDDPSTVTIIANYIPGQLPHGGPNYYTFGENIRYEIHVDNDVATIGDDIIYRATFNKSVDDPTTFFNIRLGAENCKMRYTLERSTDGGSSFETIITDGIVPPNNIGSRSIQNPVGLGAYSHETLIQNSITTASTGETVYCGPAEDPFFVDLAGVFDLGDLPSQGNAGRDGLECYNVHSIAIKVPISTLQKEGKSVEEANDILDGDFVIGVWASASRPAIRTLSPNTATESYSGDWVQVSRLGMPLTNEAVVPIGSKDEWNALTPYTENPAHFEYFYNPELGLYMDDDAFGGAVPALAALRIQKSSLAGLFGPDFPGFNFSNGADGLFGLKGSDAVAGTALDDDVFGSLLLPDAGKPRSVDLWPAFHTGVPNFPPYQLATGKMGNPLNVGKPFINNFLPNGGDMLRLNMAVPVTPRESSEFSASGLIQAAVLGLTDPLYASTANIQAIPNMDGFPNGRRLEDDVTKIELQAVGGAVLAAVGLWYDDYDPTDPDASPLTEDLLNVLGYSTGVDANDQPFRCEFPYVAAPYSGVGDCSGQIAMAQQNLAECEFETELNVSCHSENTMFDAIITFANGAPPYTVLSGNDVIITDGSEGWLSIGPFENGEGYDITITDEKGCFTKHSVESYSCVTVAVELIEFTGEALKEGNQLTWATASETNSKQFILQRSIDGNLFKNIKISESNGNTNTRSNYQYLDTEVADGLNYYRLIEQDFDNQQKVVGVIALDRGKLSVLGIQSIYPIPVEDVLNVELNNSRSNPVQLSIINSLGIEIRQLVIKADDLSLVKIDLDGFPSGIYFINLKQDSNSVTSTFVKE